MIHYEHKLHLLHCVIDCLDTHGCNYFPYKIFYCGRASKFGCANSLLIVTYDDEQNRFNEELSCEGCTTGASYIATINGYGPWNPINRKNTYYYKMINKYVYDYLENDWDRLLPDKFIPDLWSGRATDITSDIEKLYNLKAFA